MGRQEEASGHRGPGAELRRLIGISVRSRMVLPVLLVGIGGGLVGAAYLTILEVVTDWIGPDGRSTLAQAAILTLVGLAVSGLTMTLGETGNVELLVDNIHVLGGAEDVRYVRSLIPSSLLCIGAGGT